MLRWAFGYVMNRLLIVAVIWVVANGYLRSSCAVGDSLLEPFYEWSGVDQLLRALQPQR